jgi:8-oxo-dGTP pyrophosphatase MutT (NUDIX family)
MLQIAEIFLIATDGSYIMQHRDDKPNISNPGQITAFGGGIESADRSPREAAAREGWEETRLTVRPEDLEDFGKTIKTQAEHGEDSEVFWFVLRGVNVKDVDVQEGQGYYIIRPDDDLSQVNLSIAARSFIESNKDRL